MHNASSLATCAQFFRIGLMAGICTPDEAREWALSAIAKMDIPPGDIIEVSWHKPLEHLLDDLNSVEGDADLELASTWLLRRLLESLPASNAKLEFDGEALVFYLAQADQFGRYQLNEQEK